MQASKKTGRQADGHTHTHTFKRMISQGNEQAKHDDQDRVIFFCKNQTAKKDKSKVFYTLRRIERDRQQQQPQQS